MRGLFPVVAAGLWILYGEGGTRTCGFGLEECAAGRTESFAFFPFAGAFPFPFLIEGVSPSIGSSSSDSWFDITIVHDLVWYIFERR